MKKTKKKYTGFTLVEMLVVLLVIAVLVLLFVPNLVGKSEDINKQGKAAFEKVVDTQVELYVLDGKKPVKSGKITLADLQTEKYLTANQVTQAKTKYGYQDDQNLLD